MVARICTMDSTKQDMLQELEVLCDQINRYKASHVLTTDRIKTLQRTLQIRDDSIALLERQIRAGYDKPSKRTKLRKRGQHASTV